MNFFNLVKKIAETLMDGVTRTVLIVLDGLSASRQLRIVEQEDGSFRFETTEPRRATKSSAHIFAGPLSERLPQPIATQIKGSRTELVLHPKRLLFRSLELPRRASEFVDGIIRAKIDRLTPWTAENAVFGYTTGAEADNDRINLTIAATARSIIAPYINTLSKLGAQSILLSTRFENPDATIATVKLTEQIGNASKTSYLRIRRLVRFALLTAITGTVATAAITTIIGIVIQNKQVDVSRRITAQRTAVVADQGTSIGTNAALRALERRKRETPLSVILLEVLSRTLPDDTYLTEMRIQGNTIQIVGLTDNAPALISLIENSSHFDHATFFAPTTRTPNDPRERFHIEANIKPGLVPGA